MGSVVGGGEAAVSQPAIRNEGSLVRVSEPVKRPLLQLAAERRQQMGRAATISGAIDGPLPPQVGGKPQTSRGAGPAGDARIPPRNRPLVTDGRALAGL